MMNLVPFAAGQLVRSDLIEMLLPTFIVKYSNELVTPAFDAEKTSFRVKEIFSIEVTWEAHVTNIEDPLEVGNSVVTIDNEMSLIDFIKILPEDALLESDSDRIETQLKRIRGIKKSVRGMADAALVEQAKLEYAERVRRFVKLLSSDSDESLGIIAKGGKVIPGEFPDLLKLEAFFKTEYNRTLTTHEKLLLINPPILEGEEEIVGQEPEFTPDFNSYDPNSYLNDTVDESNETNSDAIEPEIVS